MGCSGFRDMKDDSVRLRWYRRAGLLVPPGGGDVGDREEEDEREFSLCRKNSRGFRDRCDTSTAASAAFSMDSLLLKRSLISSSCSLCCCAHLSFSFVLSSACSLACSFLCSSIICSFSRILRSLSSASLLSCSILSRSHRLRSSCSLRRSSSFRSSSSLSACAQKESLLLRRISSAGFVFL